MMDSTAHGFRHYMFPDIFFYDQLPEVSIIQLCKFLWSLECFMLQAIAEVELLSVCCGSLCTRFHSSLISFELAKVAMMCIHFAFDLM
ncbi:hypothetical protein NC652_034957 [Populus alba x Populus x berolinensis]|nr:hypothetical protein NC652_034957 [Populus alba x Populus x berolinensis]